MDKKSNEIKQELLKECKEISETGRSVLKEELEKLSRNKKLDFMGNINKKIYDSNKIAKHFSLFQINDQQRGNTCTTSSKILPYLNKSDSYQFPNQAVQSYQLSEGYPKLNAVSYKKMDQMAAIGLTDLKMTEYNRKYFPVSNTDNSNKDMLSQTLPLEPVRQETALGLQKIVDDQNGSKMTECNEIYFHANNNDNNSMNMLCEALTLDPMSQEVAQKSHEVVDAYKKEQHGFATVEYNRRNFPASNKDNNSKGLLCETLVLEPKRSKETQLSALCHNLSDIVTGLVTSENKSLSVTYPDKSQIYGTSDKAASSCMKHDILMASVDNVKPLYSCTEYVSSKEVCAEKTVPNGNIKNIESETVARKQNLEMSCNELSSLVNVECNHFIEAECQQIHSIPKSKKNTDKLCSIERVCTLMYTRRITQKCWETWRAYVQSNCLHKVYKEGSKNHHAKIQEFKKLLRRHKETSNINDEAHKTIEEKHKYLNVEIHKYNKALKIVATQKHSDDLKISKRNKISATTIPKHGLSQTTLGSCHTNSDVESTCKSLDLKQTTSLCHRYVAQQQIIAKQKKQLEVQEKLIHDLKLENLNKDVKLSTTQTLDHLKSCYTYCKDSYGYLKEVNKSEDHDGAQLSTPKIQKVLYRMQEREQRRRAMKERKEQIQKEIIMKKEAEMEIQKRADEEERQRLEKEIKEKRHLRYQAERRKQLAKQKIEDSMHIARKHYERKLLEKYGISALKKLVILEREKIELMNEYYKRRNLMKHFYEWLHHAQMINKNKHFVATSQHNVSLLKKGLMAFCKVYEEKIQNEQVASDFYDLHLVRLAFNKLQLHTYRQQILSDSLQQQAEQHYLRKILRTAFIAWTILPEKLKEEREKEKRKQFWRQKIQDFLPDFNPTFEESL